MYYGMYIREKNKLSEHFEKTVVASVTEIIFPESIESYLFSQIVILAVIFCLLCISVATDTFSFGKWINYM